ncbi:hypothetical protein G6O67_002697 [Ophiocordyceps sinensis]|uniref:Uncharacterized protein n=1 Tax=Ophiocordyceps sinensis TaxID=72228 RepID=A0A8H4PV41_9HYPO|nr:hypothetical protein G6O67_002697 [Ophiocordyceps sinensis]
MFYTHSRRVTRHKDAKQIEPDKQLPTAVGQKTYWEVHQSQGWQADSDLRLRPVSSTPKPVNRTSRLQLILFNLPHSSTLNLELPIKE